jgi:uncharacterized integral membrane protein (TIGR00698 family)
MNPQTAKKEPVVQEGRSPPPTTNPKRGSVVARILVPAAAVAVCHPAVPPALALFAGVVLAVTIGNPHGSFTRPAVKKLLPTAVVGLGAGMNLIAVAQAGLRGFAYTVVSISASIALGYVVARWLRVSGATGTLITVGTAICGGSAIAAAAPVLRAEDHETSASLATVFVLNGIALLIFPPLGHLVGLGQEQFGTWAALAIHDTSSVVGAGLQYGARALEVGTTIKLARALWIVPVTFALGFVHARGKGGAGKPAAKPWFIAGFLAMAAVVTYVPGLTVAGGIVAAVARRLLVVTLFLIGANLSRESLRKIGLRPLVHGVLLWVIVGTSTLLAIVAGVLR